MDSVLQPEGSGEKNFSSQYEKIKVSHFTRQNLFTRAA